MTLSLQKSDQALIAPYVTNTDGSVYALRHLPEEVVAVLFAYYSRSRESLRDNLLRLIKEGDLALATTGPDVAHAPADDDFISRAADKARAFHEKWVVGYGHSSVAEHAVVHLAIEDVSILASKAIEDARLASYTEKSTRYVPFDTARHHVPESFRNDGASGQAWRRITSALSRAYDDSMPLLVDWFVANRAPKPGQTDKGHVAACRAQACDVLRYLLPAATHTNLGFTANARVLESLLARLLSHPLAEVREIGARMKAEALLVVPTLIKYAEPSDYRRATHEAMRDRAAEILGSAADPAPTESVRLIRWDTDAEERIVEAILSGASDRSGETIRN
ncbi:MAG TPA: FAD-dependent thymidylate synthase, partial [Candidatus Eisenbacteria bacterium]